MRGTVYLDRCPFIQMASRSELICNMSSMRGICIYSIAPRGMLLTNIPGANGTISESFVLDLVFFVKDSAILHLAYVIAHINQPSTMAPNPKSQKKLP